MYTPQGQDKDDTFVLVFGSKSIAVEVHAQTMEKMEEKSRGSYPYLRLNRELSSNTKWLIGRANRTRFPSWTVSNPRLEGYG